MIIKPHKISGIYEIISDPYTDHRGRFTRIYDQSTFKSHGLDRNWLQENHSYSRKKGTVRGLHFQFPPYTETKVIRVTKGIIFDVFVDLRMDSPSFGQWGSAVLAEDNDKMLYISRGFAHGFCTLTDDCEVLYKVDNVYSPSHEGGILWNDKMLKIQWPVSAPILSTRDQQMPSFQDFIQRYKGIVL